MYTHTHTQTHAHKQTIKQTGTLRWIFEVASNRELNEMERKKQEKGFTAIAMCVWIVSCGEFTRRTQMSN